MLQVDRIVNSIFDSITWLLSETESNQVWLVDCGDIAPILEKVNGKTVAGVLLTHAHFDHIYGLPELLNLFPECRIYTNEAGLIALADARKNMSLYHESPIIVKGKPVCVCQEGGGINLYPNVIARVYETPGHHPSCLTFEAGDYLFTGDAYIPGVKIVTNLPGGNKEKAKASKERTKAMMVSHQLCAGHTQNKSCL